MKIFKVSSSSQIKKKKIEVGYGLRLGRQRESGIQIKVPQGTRERPGKDERQGFEERRGQKGAETQRAQSAWKCLSHRLCGPLRCSWLLKLFHWAPSFGTP